MGKLMEPKLKAVLTWCDHLVIAQKPAAPFAQMISQSGVPLLDLASVLPAPVLTTTGTPAYQPA